MSSLSWTGPVGSQQYLRARYLDPTTSRFTRLDPFAGDATRPQTFHEYGYVHANPIKGIDPSGLVQLLYQSLQAATIRAMLLSQRVDTFAFASGGPMLARYYQALGRIAQNIATRLIQALPYARRISTNVPVGQRNIDLLFRVANSRFLVEVKRALPARNGEALTRLVGRINSILGAGQKSQAVA